MNKKVQKWALIIMVPMSLLVVIGFIILGFMSPEPGPSAYLRFDSSSKESFWCGVVLQGDVCYEDRSFESKYIYFLDKGSDGVLDSVVVKNTSVGGGIIFTQATYQLHQNDCDDLLGVNSDAMKAITICFSEDDSKAIELQNSYNVVRQRFLVEHPNIQNFSENDSVK